MCKKVILVVVPDEITSRKAVVISEKGLGALYAHPYYPDVDEGENSVGTFKFFWVSKDGTSTEIEKISLDEDWSLAAPQQMETLNPGSLGYKPKRKLELYD